MSSGMTTGGRPYALEEALEKGFSSERNRLRDSGERSRVRLPSDEPLLLSSEEDPEYGERGRSSSSGWRPRSASRLVDGFLLNMRRQDGGGEVEPARDVDLLGCAAGAEPSLRI